MSKSEFRTIKLAGVEQRSTLHYGHLILGSLAATNAVEKLTTGAIVD